VVYSNAKIVMRVYSDDVFDDGGMGGEFDKN
jgi:hypothetical protein